MGSSAPVLRERGVLRAAPAVPRDETPARVAPRALRWLIPLVAAGVFVVSLITLHYELRRVQYHELLRAVEALPRTRLALAAGLTVVAFMVLTAYDALALRYVRRVLPAGQTMMASMIAYAASQNLGFAVLTGGSIRYRFWSSWGLSTTEIAQAVMFSAVTFWVGILAIASATLFAPIPVGLAQYVGPAAARTSGVVLGALLAAYLIWNVSRGGRTITLRGWQIAVPGSRFAFAQLVIGVVDWTLASAVAFSLLPAAPGLDFSGFLSLFLLAQVLALVSHVPGGLGVFETLMVVLLRPYIPAAEAFGALMAYRVIYYLAPFAVGGLAFAGYEIRRGQRRAAQVLRLRAAAARWVPAVLPHVLSILVFTAGAILLVSGATPPVRGRVDVLSTVLPRSLIELSHVAGSVAGAGMLVLAWALRRRLDAAYALTVGLLAAGIVASLLKGLDWEEATLMALVLAALLPSRSAFYRKSALTTEPFSPGWVIAVVAVVGASAWIGYFSHKHVEYRHDLWWQISGYAEAPRYLRASLAALSVLGVAGFLRLLRHAQATPSLPTEADMSRVRAVIERSSATGANLALLGDKALLFSSASDGFLMYGVEGRSWVALGDPVGPPEVRTELAWRFREEADRHGGWPVFYEVSADELPLYIDLGLTLLKLGEEARVPLAGFSLAGGHRKGLRRVMKDVERDGVSFEIVAPEHIDAILPELRRVSNAWLGGKTTREKGFSLGRFDDAYLRHFPAAIVRRHSSGDDSGDRGTIVAFANLWQSGDREELSVDLMRHVPDAPRSVMEYLFVQVMQWGSAQGYQWFNLGMAPLSGFENRQLAPLWLRAGEFLYRHGEHFYNFQGLRQYKEKFDPVWEPRYLASPGGLMLPRILTNVTALISGGLRGALAK